MVSFYFILNWHVEIWRVSTTLFRRHCVDDDDRTEYDGRRMGGGLRGRHLHLWVQPPGHWRMEREREGRVQNSGYNPDHVMESDLTLFSSSSSTPGKNIYI